MTQVKMPEPVAHAVKAANTGKICSLYTAGDDAAFSGVYLMEKKHVDDLITSDQAEAYADARVREAQQWQPIETASMDGRAILGAYAGQRPFEMCRGPHGDWLDAKDRIRNPSHWMPLPAPPK